MAKSKDTLIRLHRFKVDELKRRSATLDAMQADLARQIAQLDDTLAREKVRAQETDLGRVAFPAFMRSIMQRKDNIHRTIAEVGRQQAQLQDELAGAFLELKKYEIAEDSARSRLKAERGRRESVETDDLTLVRYAVAKARPA